MGINYIYNTKLQLETVDMTLSYADTFDMILIGYEYNDDESLSCMDIYPVGNDLTQIEISYSYDKFNRLSEKTEIYGSLTYETDYIYRNLNSTRTSLQVSMYCTYINNIEFSYSYTYDNKGNITKITDENDKITQYKYDDQGQLIREDNL